MVLNWFKFVEEKENKFEVGDKIRLICEEWEKSKIYEVRKVGKKNYLLFDVTGYEDPYRNEREKEYLRTESFFFQKCFELVK